MVEYNARDTIFQGTNCKFVFTYQFDLKTIRLYMLKNGVCLRPHGRDKNCIIFNLFSSCH